MSQVSQQAQRVIDAVRALGIPRKDFSVRTETYILRDQGVRWREYGNANLTTLSREARLTVVESAQRLADAGLVVTLVHRANGFVIPLVGTGGNERKVVNHVHLQDAA